MDDAPGNDQFIMVSELKPYLCILNEAKEKLPDPNTPNIQTWDSKGQIVNTAGQGRGPMAPVKSS